MSKEEKAAFHVKASAAYGSEGCPELNIPPKTDLDFEIELLSFDKAKEDWGLSFDEKKEGALKRKSEGNDFVCTLPSSYLFFSSNKDTSERPSRNTRGA